MSVNAQSPSLFYEKLSSSAEAEDDGEGGPPISSYRTFTSEEVSEKLAFDQARVYAKIVATDGKSRDSIDAGGMSLSKRKFSSLSEAYFDPEIREKKSNLFGAIFNLTNSIVGAGIIALPYALLRAGFWLGIALILVSAALMNYGVVSMVECSRSVRQMDYELAVEFALGIRGYYVSATAMILMTFGGCVAYVVVIGDSLTQVVDAWWRGHPQVFGERWFVAALFCTVFILPLCLLKHMSSLAFSSTLSIVSVLVIVLCVCVQSPKEDVGVQHSADSLPWAKPTVFSALGTIAFSLICQHSAFVIFNSLQNPTALRFQRTVKTSICLALFFNLVLAVFGFVAFRSETEGDILENFGKHNAAINVARVLLALTMVFTFPVILFVCRHSLLNLLEVSGAIARRSDRLFYALTAVLWLLAVAIGASVSSLGPVLELTGTLSAALLGYILPGLVIYKIKAKTGKLNPNTLSVDRLMPLVLVLFGMAILVIGTVTVFVG